MSLINVISTTPHTRMAMKLTVKTAIHIVLKMNHFADLYFSNGGGFEESRCLRLRISLVSAAMMLNVWIQDNRLDYVLRPIRLEWQIHGDDYSRAFNDPLGDRDLKHR